MLASVLRCGHLGACYVETKSLASSGDQSTISSVKWVPPFWARDLAGTAERVVDPTGAGNAFMGGLGAALGEGKDIHEGEELRDEKKSGLWIAVLWGTVAASFVIEQNGLPSLKERSDGGELWNGEDSRERLDLLRARLEAAL